MSKFEVYLDEDGKYRFRLRARNGQIIAVSQGYKSEEGCIKGIQSVKENAQNARIVVLE
ncbi:YegP family protein [Methanosarcina siciliae]|uniref:YegP family protein n=1 Tax=Methanosarcina siciliae TaxID=38027 RepID=UPI0009E2AB3F|nr:YegP family protein [Methanosarcina siciliae]